jgi:rhomboid protease GluP
MPTTLPTETFCVYLAKQLIAKRGFLPGAFPEAAPITAQADIVLRFSDGYSPIMVALIDRETNPGKSFTVTAAEVQAIGRACQKYAGRISGGKMMVAIQLMEVGPAAPEQRQRLAPIKRPWFYSKTANSAWVVDTTSASVWTTEGSRSRGTRKFIDRLLRSPRERIADEPPLAVAPRAFPHLTAGIIALLTVIFAAEVLYGVGDASGLQPTIATLLAFGGLTRSLVQAGEWYRLFAAPLLHADITHIAMNGVALGLAGYALEPLIGRAWFAALFVIGALSGALASMFLNTGNIVSVGASGAVMALFAAMLMIARRFPPGETRMRLTMNAMYVLIPSLLPLTSALKGVKVDYAAHFGGAFGGVTLGLILLMIWPRADAFPRLRAVAIAAALAGLAGAAYAATPVRQNYRAYEFQAALIPQNQIPTNDAAARAQSADLVKRYPRDPRARLIRGATLIQARDLPGAERELRAGLAEETLWPSGFSGELSHRLHTLLAVVLAETGRAGEAKEVAKPACNALSSGPMRQLLDQQKLCAG